jgi:hypothetical protein
MKITLLAGLFLTFLTSDVSCSLKSEENLQENMETKPTRVRPKNEVTSTLEDQKWERKRYVDNEMERISWFNPRTLSLSDMALVQEAYNFGNRTAQHIIRNYYSSKPTTKLYYKDPENYPLSKFTKRYK